MKKQIILGLITLVGMTSCIGAVHEKDGKDYVVPYSRSSRAVPRVDTKGVQYREHFRNEKDLSDKVIVYSNFDDAPARHCKSKDGHSILKENPVTKKMERLCRLDTPGARIEGSEIEVDEIDYYIANTENKYLDNEIKYDNGFRKYNAETYTDMAKYTRPQKEKIIKERYFIEESKLREIYKKELKLQYGIVETENI